jgi:succinoglycan biosynthesis protein ExoM
MGTVCVEIAVRDDRRLLDALDSLRTQSRRPDRVLVAASTATPDELLTAAGARIPDLPLEVARFPGGVVDARAGSLPLLREDTVAFLDSDERASPDWLRRLVAPIEEGRATFTAGPTRPTRPPESAYERYSDLLEASIYEDLVPRRVTYVPLQNSAWRTSDLKSLGFDPRIPFAEDHDLEVRAERAGGHGLFVPEAWVFHDKSDETSFAHWARKRYRYLVAMAMSLMKNGQLGGRLGERRRPVRHPLRYVEATMKPFALVHASVRWRRVRGRPAT